MIYPVDEITKPIIAALIAEYQPEKVILFGSYARGSAHSDSDLDLLIIKDTTERFIDRWVAVRKILSDPSRMLAIETLVLTPEEVAQQLAHGDQFLAEIINNGRVLYAS